MTIEIIKKRIVFIAFIFIMVSSIPLFYIIEEGNNISKNYIDIENNFISFNSGINIISKVAKSNDKNDEIQLGDIANCATETTGCSVGTLNSSGKCEYQYESTCYRAACCSTCNGPGSAGWDGHCCKGCYESYSCTLTATVDPETVCSKCKDGYESNGSGGCKACAKGYAGTGGTCSACGDGKWSNGGATSCSNIDAGCYGSSGTSSCPNKCSAGSFSLAGAASCTKCTGQGYQDESGKSSCKKCFGDVSDNNAKCDECKILSFSVTPRVPTYKEPGTTLLLSATFSHCDNYKPVYSPGETYSTPDSCGSIEASVKISGDGGSDSRSKTIYTKNAWKGNSTIVTRKALSSKVAANSSGDNIWGKCTPHEVPGYYICTNVQTRCGASSSSVEVPSYNYCCMDREYMGISNDTKWRQYWPEKDDCPSSLNYKIEQTKENEGKVNENTCVPYEVPNYCSPSKLKETPQNIETKECEDSETILLNSQGSECVNGEKSFYKIKCSREVRANFDYGNDNDKNTVRELFVGQGFEFAIKAITTVKCKAIFNSDNWNEVFDKFIKKIDFIDFGGQLTTACKNNNKTAWENRIDDMARRDSLSDGTRRELYELWNIIDDLRNIVKAYNNYTPTEDYAEANNLTLTYTLKNDNTKKVYPFIFNKVEDVGEYSINKINYYNGERISQPSLHDTGVFSSSCYNGTITQLKENCVPINYEIVNESKPRIVNLYPKESTINTFTGNDADENDTTVITGGNKIYTKYEITPGTWPVTMTLSGLAAESTITNNKCDIKVKDLEYTYRPIDVKNPFINDSWKKGENWVNDKYDFTKTIHATTWSEKTRNTINIAASEIPAIKSSNANYRKSGYSPYLGMCDYLEKENQDSITQKICSAIK